MASDPSPFQREVDKEKPFFDFARYFLTVAAWWGAIFLAAKAVMAAPQGIGAASVIPIIFAIPAVLFGLVLSFRLAQLTDRLTTLVFGLATPAAGRSAKVAAYIGAFLLQATIPAWWMILFFGIL
jgi:hypothetical protein